MFNHTLLELDKMAQFGTFQKVLTEEEEEWIHQARIKYHILDKKKIEESRRRRKIACSRATMKAEGTESYYEAGEYTRYIKPTNREITSGTTWDELSDATTWEGGSIDFDNMSDDSSLADASNKLEQRAKRYYEAQRNQDRDEFLREKELKHTKEKRKNPEKWAKELARQREIYRAKHPKKILTPEEIEAKKEARRIALYEAQKRFRERKKNGKS